MPVNLVTTCSVRHTDGSRRLVLAGEVDVSNHREVSVLLDDAFRAGGDVELDLAGLTHIDSTTLTVLLTERTRFDDSGRSLRVVAASPIVRRLFDITGLTYLMA
jgi:anti-anti-sigma factor